MNPFLTLHRVLFDATFFNDRGGMRVAGALGQLLLWVLLAALLGAVFHTAHAVCGEGKLAEACARITNGCIVRDAVLVCDEDREDIPPTAHVRAALQLLLPGIPELLTALPDSTVRFQPHAVPGEHGGVYLVLSDESLVAVTPRRTFELARWGTLFGQNTDVVLDRVSLQRVLSARWAQVWLMLFQWSIMALAYRILTAIPFFFIAAFILNPYGRVADNTKRVLLALLPPVAGTVIEAVAGVHVVHSRYVLLGAGFFIIARAGRVLMQTGGRGEGTTA